MVILVSVRCRLTTLLSVSGFFPSSKKHQLLSLVFFFVVSLYIGSFKIVFNSIQFVHLGCILLFQVVFVCSHSFFGDAFVRLMLFSFVLG